MGWSKCDARYWSLIPAFLAAFSLHPRDERKLVGLCLLLLRRQYTFRSFCSTTTTSSLWGWSLSKIDPTVRMGNLNHRAIFQKYRRKKNNLGQLCSDCLLQGLPLAKICRKTNNAKNSKLLYCKVWKYLVLSVEEIKRHILAASIQAGMFRIKNCFL